MSIEYHNYLVQMVFDQELKEDRRVNQESDNRMNPTTNISTQCDKNENRVPKESSINEEDLSLTNFQKEVSSNLEDVQVEVKEVPVKGNKSFSTQGIQTDDEQLSDTTLESIDNFLTKFEKKLHDSSNAKQKESTLNQSKTEQKTSTIDEEKNSTKESSWSKDMSFDTVSNFGLSKHKEFETSTILEDKTRSVFSDTKSTSDLSKSLDWKDFMPLSFHERSLSEENNMQYFRGSKRQYGTKSLQELEDSASGNFSVDRGSIFIYSPLVLNVSDSLKDVKEPHRRRRLSAPALQVEKKIHRLMNSLMDLRTNVDVSLSSAIDEESLNHTAETSLDSPNEEELSLINRLANKDNASLYGSFDKEVKDSSVISSLPEDFFKH